MDKTDQLQDHQYRREYYKNEEGEWYETMEGIQCPQKIGLFLDLPCQGIVDHKEPHWAYGPSGMLEQKYQKGCENYRQNIASSSTPDGHDHYIRPKDMHDKHYISYYSRRHIADPALIKRLEDGDPTLNISRFDEYVE